MKKVKGKKRNKIPEPLHIPTPPAIPLITQIIEHLKMIRKEGGNIDTVDLSCGSRDARPSDPGYEDDPGWVQKYPDGTFTITISGNHKRHEPNTKHKKSAGKKKANQVLLEWKHINL